MYLCDFHPEQAWERWVSKKDNGVADSKDTVLCLLRRIARASTVEKFHSAVSALKCSIIWNATSSEKLRKWINKTWLNVAKVNNNSANL